MKEVNNSYIIILDNGHGKNTPGKLSPDGRLREFAYAREITKKIYDKLTVLGYSAHILVPESDDISLYVRTKRANLIYQDNNKKAILISVHCNAAGSDGKWHNAKGWSVFVSNNASNNSKELAKCLKDAAQNQELKIRLQYPDKAYWQLSLYICRKTNCPAVLTENLFLDNEEDVNFLLSEEGKEKITDLHVQGIINYLKLK